MRQIFLFSFIFLLSVLIQASLPLILLTAKSSQHWCEQRIRNSPEKLRDISAALACGTEIPTPSPWRNLLIRTGLYHLVVVSGSHLVLLEILLFRFPGTWFWIASLGLTLLTGFQPPLVRGMIQRSLPEFIHGSYRAALAYGMTVLFIPPWTHSLSLALSTAASLGLSIHLDHKEKSNLNWLVANILPWLLTIPLVAAFSPIHPIQILCHVFFSSLFTFFATPLSYLQLCWPSVPGDWLYQCLEPILIPFAALNTSQEMKLKTFTPWMSCLYLCMLFLLIHFWNVQSRRRR